MASSRPPTGRVFADVPFFHPFAKWIEQAASDGHAIAQIVVEPGGLATIVVQSPPAEGAEARTAFDDVQNPRRSADELAGAGVARLREGWPSASSAPPRCPSSWVPYGVVDESVR